MPMIDKAFKTILFASLAFVMVLPLSMIENSYAEFSPEIKAKAIEGAEIWKKLEKEKEKEKINEDKVSKLTKDFNKIRYELNKVGIASAKQYEENPDYWRSLSHPEFPDEVSHKIHLTSYDSKAVPASHNCSNCQNGYFISGFDGSIDWFSTHVVRNNYNVEIQHSPSSDFTSTSVRPSYASLIFSWIDDVPRNSIHKTTAGAYALNQSLSSYHVIQK